jgi:site-specific DNA-methyltransferase (adenine-specific)
MTDQSSFFSQNVAFSSASAEWETPKVVYDYLNNIFKFELDPCSTDENHKCKLYFTKQTDGLNHHWNEYASSVFMNPVYGEPEVACKKGCKKKKCIKRGYHNTEYVPGIVDWMQKAWRESLSGVTVVCLVPARVDTGWWHDYCMCADEVWVIKRRLSFINRTLTGYNKELGESQATPAPFPSAVVVFNGNKNHVKKHPVLRSMSINKKTGEVVVI